MKPQTKSELIEEVITNFDFSKMKKVQELLEWNTDSFGDVSIGNLVVLAQDLLSKAYDYTLKEKDNCFIVTGGFEASGVYIKDESAVGGLCLKFVVTSWDTIH